MSRPRVFFVCDSRRFNISSAHRYGDPVFLFRDKAVSPFNTDRFLQEVGEKLDFLNFDPEKDFVAVTGPAVHVSLFMGHVMAAYPKVWILLFDAKPNCYKERLVTRPDQAKVS